MSNDKFEPTKYSDEYRLRVDAVLNGERGGPRHGSRQERHANLNASSHLNEALKRAFNREAAAG